MSFHLPMAVNNATIGQYWCLIDKLVQPCCFSLWSMNGNYKGRQTSNVIVASIVVFLCENDNKAVAFKSAINLEGDSLILCYILFQLAQNRPKKTSFCSFMFFFDILNICKPLNTNLRDLRPINHLHHNISPQRSHGTSHHPPRHTQTYASLTLSFLCWMNVLSFSTSQQSQHMAQRYFIKLPEKIKGRWKCGKVRKTVT